jgi:hypothetical protein
MAKVYTTRLHFSDYGFQTHRFFSLDDAILFAWIVSSRYRENRDTLDFGIAHITIDDEYTVWHLHGPF